MVRRLFVVLALAAISFTGISSALASPASAAPPSAIQQCMNGGWHTLTDGSGQPFKNQGQCISSAVHHPVGLADLTGSFSGTTTWTFGNSCGLINQVFDATYPGSFAVKAVMLHIGGCVAIGGSAFPYNGTFGIATNIGTLNGDAAGVVPTVAAPQPVDIELTLTVTSGTGAFAATTGTIRVSILWSTYVTGVPSTYPVTGSVTIP